MRHSYIGQSKGYARDFFPSISGDDGRPSLHGRLKEGDIRLDDAITFKRLKEKVSTWRV